MKLGDLLSGNPREALVLPTDCAVQEALGKMARRGESAVVVAEYGRPVGVFSGPDLVRLFQRTPAAVLEQVRLTEAMTDRFTVASPDEDLRATMVKMLNAEIRHLIVADGEKIVGRLALCEIVETMFEVLDGEIRQLNAYISDLHEAGMD